MTPSPWDNLPVELTQRRQWVGFRIVANGHGKPRKIPVVATDPDRNASSTDPATWRTFEEATAGLARRHYTAIGYAFADDVVGVDLDGERWVVGDGELSEEAEALIERCCSYAEWSISGIGVHVLLHGRHAHAGHRNDDAGLEVYGSKRFFIMTGRRLKAAPATITENQAALDWVLGRYFGEAAQCAESTEVMTSEVSAISGISAISAHSNFSTCSETLSVQQIIDDAQPTRMGQRNACIFRLARALKFNSGNPEPNGAKWKAVVRTWHRKALPIIGTKNFDETWADFLRAYQVARLPVGVAIDDWAFAEAKKSLPAAANEYETARVKLLVGICWHLAALNPQRRFFLSSHRAAAFMGVCPNTAMDYLRMLCADGVIKVVDRGSEYRATRFEFVGDFSPSGLPACAASASAKRQAQVEEATGE